MTRKSIPSLERKFLVVAKVEGIERGRALVSACDEDDAVALAPSYFKNFGLFDEVDYEALPGSPA